MPASSFTKATTPFLGCKASATAKGASLAVFGAPHGTPYRGIDNRVHAKAPNAFRAAMKGDAAWISHWDFDLESRILPDAPVIAVDLGNLKTTPANGKANRKRIEQATRACLEAGAVPIMFGGDDSTPIPFLAAYSGSNPITVVQIDAHIDWRDEREKERFGFSSTMRRASEMDHVWRIVQAGARGIGSAREEEVIQARSWGARIVTANELHAHGMEQALQHVEPGSDCVISFDLDVLDTSEMPAVAAPSPGGLGYRQLRELIAGVAAKARIAGFTMVEFVPARDPFGVYAYTAGRIAAHVLGHVARQRV